MILHSFDPQEYAKQGPNTSRRSPRVDDVLRLAGMAVKDYAARETWGSAGHRLGSTTKTIGFCRLPTYNFKIGLYIENLQKLRFLHRALY